MSAGHGGVVRMDRFDLLARAGALVAIVLMAVLVGRLNLHAPPFTRTIAAVGLLLLGGDLFSVLVERVGLPHITGYLLAGLILGPHVLHTIDHQTVESLSLVNALALALIALSAGSELTFRLLREGLKSLSFSIVTQTFIALPLIAGAFFLLRSFIPFLSALGTSAVFGVAVIWGVLGVSRSPSASLAVIAQVKPDGPLTRYTLAMVVAFDIIVLLLFAVAIQLGRALILGVEFDVRSLGNVGHEIAASTTFGITLGLLIAAYLTFVKRGVILFVVATGYAVTLASQWLHYDTLLLFVVAGFVVANTSDVGDQLMEGIARGGRLVYVLFFAVAGAHLNVPLLAKLWPVALALAAVRVAATFLATRVSGKLADDAPVVRKYGWMPLVSQAGVTIGMSVVVGQALPGIGPDVQALTIAVVGLNEAVGPVLFKRALDLSGESGKAHSAEP